MRQRFCFSRNMGLVGLFITDGILNYYNSSRAMWCYEEPFLNSYTSSQELHFWACSPKKQTKIWRNICAEMFFAAFFFFFK